MQKPFYDDLLLVLTLTLITVIVLLIPGNLLTITVPVIYIPYILLLLFLPGYSLLAAVDPEFAQDSRAKRVGLSLVASLFISIVLAVLVTYTPLKVLSDVIVYVLGAFSIILLLSAILRRKSYHYVHFIEQDGENLNINLQKIEKKDNHHRFDNSRVINDLLLNATDISKPQPELGDNRESTVDEDFHLDQDDTLKLDQPFKKEEVEGASEKEVETSPKETGQKAVNVEKIEATKVDKVEAQDPEETGGDDGNVKPQRGPSYLDLAVVLLLTVVCTVFILEPSLNQTILSSAVGVLLMVILPGYAIMATIYPRKDDLNMITRLVLSFGVSYFLTSVIGLILNYAHLGSGLNPILMVLAVVSFIFIITSFAMRLRTRSKERLHEGRTPPSETSILGGSRNRNILTVGVIVIVLLLVAAPTALNMFKPTDVVAANSTDFYVLGPDGHNITNTYPQNVTNGTEVKTTIVLVNHENAETSYQIVTKSNQTVMDEINVTLKPNEKKEIPYNFTAGEAGARNVQFILFKLPNLSDPYHVISFLLNIVSGQNPTTVDNTGSADSGTSDSSSSQDYTEPSNGNNYSPPADTYTPPESQPEAPADQSPDDQGSSLDDYQSEY